MLGAERELDCVSDYSDEEYTGQPDADEPEQASGQGGGGGLQW